MVCNRGSNDKTYYILENFYQVVLVDGKDGFGSCWGMTALHVAALMSATSHRQLGALRLLLELGASVNLESEASAPAHRSTLTAPSRATAACSTWWSSSSSSERTGNASRGHLQLLPRPERGEAGAGEAPRLASSGFGLPECTGL